MTLNCCKRLWASHWFRLLLVIGVVGGVAMLARVGELWLSASEPDASRREASPYLLLGAAALIASLVALFGDAVRRWIWRPILTTEYLHRPDYCDTPVLRGTTRGQQVASDCYYFSLRVENKGTISADTVEVFATDLCQWVNGNWTPVRRYSMDLKWAWLGVARLPTLAPKMDRFCNIGHIIDPAQRANFAQDNEDLPGLGQQTAILSLDLEARPNHGIHLLRPGKYRLTIQLAAANHKPVTKVLEIDVIGGWYPNNLPRMLQQGIRIELL